MANLKDWILLLSHGEPIEAVVIGEMGWGDYRSDDVPNYDSQPRAKVISWDEAIKWIDYEFDDGYGAPGCNAIVAWTPSSIITVYQYDGAVGPFVLPRNPIDYLPFMPGG